MVWQNFVNQAFALAISQWIVFLLFETSDLYSLLLSLALHILWMPDSLWASYSNGAPVPVLNSSLAYDSVTPWMVARQAPLSTGFSRQEYFRGLPFLPPGDLPNPGTELTTLTFPASALAGRFFSTSATWKVQTKFDFLINILDCTFRYWMETMLSNNPRAVLPKREQEVPGVLDFYPERRIHE